MCVCVCVCVNSSCLKYMYACLIRAALITMSAANPYPPHAPTPTHTPFFLFLLLVSLNDLLTSTFVESAADGGGFTLLL